jgi:hypothetical protein
LCFRHYQDAFIQLDPLRQLDEGKVLSMNLPPSMTVIQPHDPPAPLASDDDDDDNEDNAKATGRGGGGGGRAGLSDNANPAGVFKGHEPKWYPFMFETPGDGQGEVLCSVQLIPCGPDFGADPLSVPPIPDISPPTKAAFLEVVAVGLRNMLP